MSRKSKLYTAIGAGAVGVLIVIYIILGAVFGSMNPAKWGKAAEPGAPSDEPSIVCAILYPDLQENGDIWQTGGMEPTHAKTMREALEADFEEDFFTFADDGTIASAGKLRAVNGYSFKIQKNTTRAPEMLSDKPADIGLVDSETYEITYCDPDGEAVTILSESIKEILATEPSDSAQPSKDPDNTEPQTNPTDKTADDPTDGKTKPTEGKTEPTEGKTEPTDPGKTNESDNIEPTIYTDPVTGDTIVNDIF